MMNQELLANCDKNFAKYKTEFFPILQNAIWLENSKRLY